MPKSKPATEKRRIFELDLLRGFFIFVIILDHLQFWPSPFQFLTGQGRLWVSAAEGFFLISGLLIGYIRAYKGAKLPFRDVAVTVLRRAALLFLWYVIITVVVYLLKQVMPGDHQLLPTKPDEWIYFLRLYAIMLAVTPLFLWLLRQGWWLAALLISVGTYAMSLLTGLNEAALQWQLLFFGAALIGWKLEAILAFLRNNQKYRNMLLSSLIGVTLTTMVLSYLMVHGWGIVENPNTPISLETYVSTRGYIDPWFSDNPMSPGRIVLSFIWFGGLLALFHVVRRWLLKYLGWLLLPFGEASLTAYCLQAIFLVPIVTFLPITDHFWLNGLIGAMVLVFFNLMLRIPIVKKILPR